jgi:hypothetical protein
VSQYGVDLFHSEPLDRNLCQRDEFGNRPHMENIDLSRYSDLVHSARCNDCRFQRRVAGSIHRGGIEVSNAAAQCFFEQIGLRNTVGPDSVTGLKSGKAQS